MINPSVPSLLEFSINAWLSKELTMGEPFQSEEVWRKLDTVGAKLSKDKLQVSLNKLAELGKLNNLKETCGELELSIYWISNESKEHKGLPQYSVNKENLSTPTSAIKRVSDEVSGQRPPSTIKISKTLGRFKSPLAKKNTEITTPKPFSTPLSVKSTPKRPALFSTPLSTTPFKTPNPRLARRNSSSDLTDPVLAQLTQSKMDLQNKLSELESWERKLKLYLRYMEKDEPKTVTELAQKWRTATREILVTLRDTVGPISVGNETQGQHSWGDPPESNEVRTLTLKEMAASCRFDIAVLGSYDEEMDVLNDE